MLVEILVLGRDEGVDHELRDRLDRQIEPPLAWRIRPAASRRRRARASSPAARSPAAANSPAGPWRNARASPAGRADADEEHDGPDREQQAEEAQQKPHRRSHHARSLAPQRSSVPPMIRHRPSAVRLAYRRPRRAGPSPGPPFYGQTEAICRLRSTASRHCHSAPRRRAGKPGGEISLDRLRRSPRAVRARQVSGIKCFRSSLFET